MVLVIDEDTVLGEICHIRARRKGGPRYDPSLSEEQKNSAANLVLLCPTCHTLVDKDRSGAFSVEWLEAIKAEHEQGAAIEFTSVEARLALAILAKHTTKGQKRIATQSATSGGGSATARTYGIAIAIGGNNLGDIHVKQSAARGTRGYAANSLGADSNLAGYVDYLCELWVRYMKPLGIEEEALRGRIGKNIKTKFRLAKRTRNDLPAERFWDLAAFLNDELAATPVGKKHLRRGTKLCSTFAEWRSTTR